MATATAGDEAVDLDLNAMTASLQVAKANFTHITFREMPETYTVGSDVVCNYVIGSALEASSRDWVGLYKVGWRTPDQYVCYVWSPLPANYAPGKVYENQVVFPGMLSFFKFVIACCIKLEFQCYCCFLLLVHWISFNEVIEI